MNMEEYNYHMDHRNIEASINRGRVVVDSAARKMWIELDIEDDEDLMHEIMGFAMGHPDGFCRKCGSSQTIYEMDTDGYPCDDPDCEGLLLHPAQHLGIM